MNIQTINPYIRRAMYSEMRTPDIRARAIFDYELIYVAGGSFLLTYAGQPYVCPTGTVLLLHPGVEHSFSSLGEPLVQPHIHFDLCYQPNSEAVGISFKHVSHMTAEELAQIRPDEFCEHAVSPILQMQDRDAFLAAFYADIDRYIADNKQTTLAGKQLMLGLIDLILRETPGGVPMEPSPGNELREIAMIKSFIDANYRSALTLKTLQEQFYYSRSFIERHFKARYGKTVMQYYTMKRMTLARKLLQTKSVTQTAEELSFSSIYAFSRAFKQYYGFSPTAAGQPDGRSDEKKE
ncbi:MAG: AraC family transcriptional regulator [Clostridia bacterium]|nr:AraC family transcriptional regulator [Clostridia bacterium]